MKEFPNLFEKYIFEAFLGIYSPLSTHPASQSEILTICNSLQMFYGSFFWMSVLVSRSNLTTGLVGMPHFCSRMEDEAI